MATNNRDVKMTLSVETLGAEDIKKLQTSVLSLAKEAGDAAPEFEKLAAEIGQLGSQADALRSFETLAAKVTEAAQAQDLAAAKAAELKTKYDQLQGSTDEARARQEAVTKEWLKASSGLDKLAADLRTLKQTTDAAAKSEDDYKQSVRENQEAQAAAVTRVRELNEARKAANKELSEAEANERRAARASEQSADAAERNQRALAAQQTELKKLGDELDALGLSSQNVVASQVQLKQALDATGRAAQEAAELGRQSAAIDKEAAEAKDRLAAAARAQAAAAEESARRRVAAEADVDRAQDEILQRTLAVENRKNEIRQRTADLQRQRANQQTTDDLALLNRQYAAEEAASDRIIAMKKAAYDRIAALARENAQKTEAAARQSAQALADAFGSIGIRNVQDVNAEIEQVRRSMQLVAQQSGLTGSALAEAMGRGNARVNELQREVRELSGQLTLADRAANLFKNSMGQIAAGNLIADAIGALVERVKEMGREFIAVNVQAEQMRRALTSVYGDAGVAAKQMDFLRGAASAAGISISGISDSFVKFSAATRTSGVSLAQTNALFSELTRAGSVLGLSTERVQLALDALGQIASKGVVSMEELRQQLGDSLPGALSLTAKGLGVTDAELIKLVESGRLASVDFFPALTKGLKTLSGEADGLTQSWGRLKTALTTVAQAIGEAGFVTVLTGALKILGGTVGAVAVAIATLGEKMFLAGKAAIVFFESLRGNGTQALAFFSEEVEKSDARIQRMRDTLDSFLDPTSEAAKRLREAAGAQQELTQAAALTEPQIKALADSYETAAESAGAYGENTKAVELANAAVTKAAGDTSAAYVQIGVQLTKLAETQEADVVVKSKGVKAAEQQAQALEDEAKARGTLNERLTASVQGNQLVVSAAEAEAQARSDLATTLATELRAKTQLAQAEEGGIARRKVELDQLKEKVEKAAAEANVARESLNAIRAKAAEEERAAKQEVANLKTSAQALAEKNLRLKDNSASATQYQQEMLRTAESLEKVRAASEQGKATTQQLADAERAAAIAAERYRDAMNDQRANIEATTRAKRAKLEAETTELQLALEIARSDEARARRMGDEKGVREALIRQKQIEIEIAELQIQYQRIEAEGSLAVARAKLAELKATEPLNEAKRIELETEIKLAEIKLRQAGVREEVVRRMREEVAALQTTKSALDGERDAVDSNTESWSRNIKEREKAAQLAKAAKGEFAYDEQGYRIDAGGQRSMYEIPSEVLKMNWMNNMDMRTGLPVLPWEEWIKKERMGMMPSVKEANANRAAQQAEQQAAQQQKARDQLAGYKPAQTGPFPTLNEVPAPATATRDIPPPRTININFGGRTTAINVASAQDEAALIALLQQLEGAAGRAGG